MCAVVGASAPFPVAQFLYDGLITQQHRGQDAAGVCFYSDGRLHRHRGFGWVRDALDTTELARISGKMGIGHLRYPTAGEQSAESIQPVFVTNPGALVVAHNGNLTNAPVLQRLLRRKHRYLSTDNDSELFAHLLALRLKSALEEQEQGQRRRGDITQAFFKASTSLMREVRGAYSVVALSSFGAVVAMRDPHGIRPLAMGYLDTPEGRVVLFASESAVLTSAGCSEWRDVLPGEVIVVNRKQQVKSQICAPDGIAHTPCAFEWVYFARPDTVIDGLPVYGARRRMGHALAKRIDDLGLREAFDVVIPVPDSSHAAASALAETLGDGRLCREGLVKNRYTGRTFILPHSANRANAVRRKISVVTPEVAGKRVLLVDDSIVRGTTSRQIVQQVRAAGAKEVLFASAAPPLRHPNIYGIDLPSVDDLIAHGRTDEEVAKYIQVDTLIYQTLGGLKDSILKQPGVGRGLTPTSLEVSVFDGDYGVSGKHEKEVAQTLKRRSRVIRPRSRRRPLIARVS